MGLTLRPRHQAVIAAGHSLRAYVLVVVFLNMLRIQPKLQGRGQVGRMRSVHVMCAAFRLRRHAKRPSNPPPFARTRLKLSTTRPAMLSPVLAVAGLAEGGREVELDIPDRQEVCVVAVCAAFGRGARAGGSVRRPAQAGGPQAAGF